MFRNEGRIKEKLFSKKEGKEKRTFFNSPIRITGGSAVDSSAHQQSTITRNRAILESTIQKLAFRVVTAPI